MAGFFSKIMTTQGRERLQAEEQYEDCLKTRTAVLEKCRIDAVTEIKTLYSDAVFLIAKHSRDFLAASEAGNVLIKGRFADEFVPHLDYVDTRSPETNVEAIRLAISSFVESMKAYAKQVSLAHQSLRYGTPATFDRFTPYERSMIGKGYYLSQYQLNKINGIDIKKNDRRITVASQANAASLRDVPKKLYDAVMLETAGCERGVSRIEISIGVGVSEFETTQAGVEVFYSDRYRKTIEHEKQYLLSVCQSIMPFLTLISAYMSKAHFTPDVLEWSDDWMREKP